MQVPDIQITYTPKLKISQLPRVSTSKEVYKVFYERWDKGKIEFLEQSKVMFLNKANRILGIYELSSGGMAGTIIDPKIVFIAALKTCATTVILAHNHPSGNLHPSKEDIRITRRLIEIGELLDIRVFDHLIITKEGYISLADEGYI